VIIKTEKMATARQLSCNVMDQPMVENQLQVLRWIKRLSPEQLPCNVMDCPMVEKLLLVE